MQYVSHGKPKNNVKNHRQKEKIKPQTSHAKTGRKLN